MKHLVLLAQSTKQIIRDGSTFSYKEADFIVFFLRERT